jgi:secreted trypsin-like serine protease
MSDQSVYQVDAPPREGDRMWITTGWGDDMNVADSDYLKELSLPVASKEMCKNDWKSYYNEGSVSSDRAYKEDACTGDSGGPAVHKTRDGRWRIIGITAAGSMKCSTTQASVKAGVFTNVSKFRRWIDVNTGGMC